MSLCQRCIAGCRRQRGLSVRFFPFSQATPFPFHCASNPFNLGIAYYRGYGVPQDLAQAKAWFRKAAAQGNQRAIDALKHLE